MTYQFLLILPKRTHPARLCNLCHALYQNKHEPKIQFSCSIQKIQIVRTITCNRFKLESPLLPQICIRDSLSWSFIDCDLQDDLVIPTQNSRKRRSALILYTDEGGPMGVTRPNVLLLNHYCFAWRCLWFIESIKMSKRKINWRISIRIHECNVGQQACKTFAFHS